MLPIVWGMEALAKPGLDGLPDVVRLAVRHVQGGWIRFVGWL